MNTEILVKTLIDLRDHGTRHDITPTCMFNTKCGHSMGPPRTNGYEGYIKEMDEYVRETAAKALIDAGYPPDGEKK